MSCTTRKVKAAKSLEGRLAAYALASGSLLLAAGEAKADIIYSGPQNIPVNSGTQPVSISLDGNGPEFTFEYYTGTDTANIEVAITGNGLGIQAFYPGSFNPYVALDSRGTIINGSATYAQSAYLQKANGKSNYINQTGYFGVEFTGADSMTHYGWIQFSGASAGNGTIDDWAYQTTPNAPIKAGQTSAVPEPATLTLLASGAVGLLLWKRRRKAEAKSAVAY